MRASRIASPALTPTSTTNTAPTGFIRVSGSPIAEATLRATALLNDADGLGTLRYQWLANGRVLEDETRSTLTIEDDWVGKALSVRVRYTDAQGHVETVLSARTAPVMAASDEEDEDEKPESEHVSGLDGDDDLIGHEGDDTLDGGAGADILAGGIGDDTYYIDNANDRIRESKSAGIDKVISSISCTLQENLERLTLTGNAALNGTGNTLANQITGNSGANRLIGQAGNDTLIGGDGNDILMGGAGKDELVGGLGNDYFKFNKLNESGINSTVCDVVSGFVRGQDKIDLSGLDANVSVVGNQAFVNFVDVATAFSKAGQLKYEDGVLYANTDADASAEFSIALTGVTTLTMVDIIA